jgi:hypothetical protein
VKRGGFFFPEMTPEAEKLHFYLTEAGELETAAGTRRVNAKEVTSYFKEFLILFFGAAWSQQSLALTEELVKFLRHVNAKPGKPTVDVIYIGNEQSEEELKDYIQKHLADHSSGTNISGYHFGYNHDLSFALRELLEVDSVPHLIVMDRNLDILTREGAADVMHLASQNPEQIRAIWIDQLQAQIDERKLK